MKIGYYIILITLLSEICYSQELPKIITQNPEAATLSKYSEYPVGNFTGIPDINVPLYNIKSGDISLPISLNYHAGGFKVSEEASWVGLGWTLNVNGIITKTVHGVDDFNGSIADGTYPYHSNETPKIVDITQSGTEFPDYYELIQSFGYTIFASPGNNGFVPGIYLENAYSRHRSDIASVDYQQEDYSPYKGISFDWEPDVYSLNFMGMNGKFVFDQDKNIHFLDKKDIDIKYTNDNWIVRSNDGFQYFFEAKESVTNFYGREYSGSWYLTKIISPNNKEMSFIYQDSGKYFWQYFYSETAKINGTNNGEPTSFFRDTPNYTSSKYKKQYLTRIEFDEGYIVFNRDPDLREDLKDGERLKSITVYDNQGHQIKNFDFISSYFNTNSDQRGFRNVPDVEYSYYKKRLKLEKVVESNGNVSKPYIFRYSNLSLPNKDSFKQDHWGFANGPANGGSTSGNSVKLIPSFKGQLTFKNRWRQSVDGNLACYNIYDAYDNVSYFNLIGANRNSDSAYMGGCILEEIIYPTGGKTIFEFEANDYGNQGELEQDFTYSTYSKDVRLICSSNSTDIVQYSGAELSNDVIEIINPKIEFEVYSTGSPISIPGSMKAIFSSSGLNKTYFLNSHLSSSDTNYVDELPSGFTGPINLQLESPESNLNQTFIVTFTCTVKRALNPAKVTTGGLRIKKVIHHDGNDVSKDIIKTYNYEEEVIDDNGVSEIRSSGKLKNPLKYYHLGWNNQSCSSFFTFSSSNLYSLSISQSSHIGYSKVTENIGNYGEIGRNEYLYYNYTNDFYKGDERPPGVPNSIEKSKDGKLKEYLVYSDQGKLIYKESNNYLKLDEKVIKGVFQDGFVEPYMNNASLMYGKGGMHYYPIYSRWEPLFSKTETTFNSLDNNYVETRTHYQYNNENLLPKLITTYDSQNNILQTKNYYPNDVENVNSLGEPISYNQYLAISRLKKQYSNGTDAEYKTFQPVQVENFKNDVLLSRQRTIYDTWYGTTLPEYVQITKGNQDIENRIQFHDYDMYGNPLELSKADGSPISYIWGYDKQYPVAKVENATYADVIGTGIAESIYNNSSTTDSAMRTELNKIRSGLPDAMVTTYTYDPLIGVTSITDPKGYTIFYYYDDFNRLKEVKDADGNLVTDYEYRYKQSQ